MILTTLYELYDRLKGDNRYAIVPPGYSLQKITFKVVLYPDGSFDIQDARIYTKKGLRPQQIRVPGRGKPSGSGLNPCFLWDNTGYMLGFKPNDNKPQRTEETFRAFRERHLSLENEIQSPAFSAVCRFLEKWRPQQATGYPVLAELETGFGVFQIAGQQAYVHQDPAVDAWWQRQLANPSGGTAQGMCLITGKQAPIAQLHPKIKGVTGAQSSGAVIVGFNEDAYESYGKKQSRNAPVSQEAAFRYTTALNALLDGPMSFRHRIRVGDTTVVFWTDEPSFVEDVFSVFAAEGSNALAMAEESQDEGLRKKIEVFLRAVRSGEQAWDESGGPSEPAMFYVLGLAPNAARISIRFFWKGHLRELLINLHKHYRDIQMVRSSSPKRRKQEPEMPPIWLLLRQTARESKEIPPVLAGPLLRAVLTGQPYPAGLFQAVIRRIHADRTINYIRACIIRGYLTRNLKQEVSVSLDKNRKDPSYRLGRLFAALEKTQMDALKHVGASIRDRFYSSASATPGSVFPRLLRTYQHHLSKLEGGWKVNRERLVQEIMADLNEFPKHLTLAEQGTFAIGYYHQMQDFYTKTDEKPTEQEEA